ncbi:MAG: hypothetical protein JWR04_3144 [Rhodoglobus sp.]|nr:hypothetical protein [Rhodoglobus sp.]
MLYPLIVLIMVAFAIWFIARRGRGAEQSALARRISLFGSLAVLVPFLAVFGLPLLYLAERFLPWLHVPSTVPFGYAWWQYPFPIVGAVITAVVVLVALNRRTAKSEVPVVPIAPRGWTTFTNRRELVVAIVSAGVLIAVSVAAGLASVTNDAGLHILIEFPGPEGERGGTATFYGWAYSVPVMVGIAVLSLLVWLALRASALPAFRRPDTVAQETLEREQVASALLRLYIAAVLLPLGGALTQIGGAGMGQTGIGIPGVGDFRWSLGYSSFAFPIEIVGEVLELAGVLILLLGIFSGRKRAAS